jgi:ATP-dependent Clp protease ATP-binding subunit ClpA
VIQESVKKPLAEELLFGKLVKGGVVKVSVDKETDKLSFAYEEATTPARRETPDEPDAPKEPEYVE